MGKATDELLKDHKMIRKVLGDWTADNPRSSALLKTLQRIVAAHAWFEDEFLFPALASEPLVEPLFLAEFAQEHRDIGHLLKLLRKLPDGKREETDCASLQLRGLLEAHFVKEEKALFPLAERLLGEAGLMNMGAEMEKRKTEVRKLKED